MFSREGALVFYVANLPLLLLVLFLVPRVLGLSIALKDVNRSYAFLAGALGAVGTTLIIIATALIFPTDGLSHGYLAATTDAQRAVYVGAQQAIFSITDALKLPYVPLFGLWILITSLLMLKGAFQKGITHAFTGRFFMKSPWKPGDLTLTQRAGACGAVTSQRILL